MEWLTSLWSWLEANHNPIAALSSLVFGISTASIAVLAYRLNYRNNFGSKPLVLITGVGGARDIKTGKRSATFKCEIWNRRKYTVDLKMAMVKFRTVKPRGDKPEDMFVGGWLVDKRGWSMSLLEETLEHGKHTFFEGSFPVDEGYTAFEMPKVKIAYFDSRTGGTRWVKSGARQRWRNELWQRRVRRAAKKVDMQ